MAKSRRRHFAPVYQPKTYTFRTTWGNGPITGGCLVVAATIRDRRGDMTVNGRQAGRLAAGPDAGGSVLVRAGPPGCRPGGRCGCHGHGGARDRWTVGPRTS